MAAIPVPGSPAPAGPSLHSHPRITPEEYFQFLRDARAAAKRMPVHSDCASQLPPLRRSRARLAVAGRLVHAGSPPLHAGACPGKQCAPHVDVRRSDGAVLRVTRPLLACFFDLTVGQACDAMLTNVATLKRLRSWYGAGRWPRSLVVGGSHPAFTLDSVREHRECAARWALEAGERVIHDSLCRASRIADSPAPPRESAADLRPFSPGALDALDALDGEDFREMQEAITDFPFSLPEPLMPAEPARQEPEPEPARPEPEPEPAEPAAKPPGFYPWGDEGDYDEDADFFANLEQRCAENLFE